jgi:hypothetical protein
MSTRAGMAPPFIYVNENREKKRRRNKGDYCIEFVFKNRSEWSSFDWGFLFFILTFSFVYMF